MIDHVRLDYLLSERGMKSALAKKLNVHKSYVSRLCRRDENITTNRLIEICDFLHVEPGEILKLDRQRKQ